MFETSTRAHLRFYRSRVILPEVPRRIGKSQDVWVRFAIVANRRRCVQDVGKLYLVDPEELDRTNGNRYIGVRHDDPVPGLKKVNAGDPPDYGGRLCVSIGGNGCLVCLDVLDKQEAGHDLGGEVEARNAATPCLSNSPNGSPAA